jgi:uncharacterized repeat protein (TIGR02543 family)
MTATVTDTTGLTDTQRLTITVSKANSAPVLAPITATQSITELTTLTFTAAAIDTDQPTQALTFTLGGNVPDGASIARDTGAFTWTPTEAQGPGTYYVNVIVTDAEGGADSQWVRLTVLEDNTAPVLSPLDDQVIAETATLTFTAEATDPDGHELSFSFVNAPGGARIHWSSGLFQWTPTETQGPGIYTATIMVDDNDLSDSQTLTITVTEVNVAPVLDAIGDQTVDEGATVSFTTTATDGDEPANTLSYSLSGAPGGATIDGSSGFFSWTTDENDGGDIYPLTVIVSDGMLTDSETITITVNEVNTAPVLDAIGDQTVDEGDTVTFTATATDVDEPADTLSYSLSGEPSGATIDPTTGTFAWTTDESDGPGEYPLTVTVSDGVLTDSEAITITVTEVNAAPVLDAIGDQTVDEGDTVTFTATATDADEPANTLSYSLNGAPSGAMIDNSSGTFSWTTDESDGPGAYPMTVIVSDGDLTDSEMLTLTVAEVNTAPVLDAIGNQTVDEGDTVTFTATATDSDEPANTLSYSLGGAPSGATIDPTTGAFNWTTDESDGPGVYPMTVIVSDGDLTDSETLTLTVNEVVVPISHTLSVNVVGSGTVTPTGGTYISGTVVSLAAEPKTGWQFDGWTGDLVGTVTKANLLVDADKTVTGTFSLVSTPVSYTLTTIISPTVGGAVTLDPTGGVYPEGTVVTMTAIPADDYIFTGWSGDLFGAVNPMTLTMTQDAKIVAEFDSIAFFVYLPLAIKSD